MFQSLNNILVLLHTLTCLVLTSPIENYTSSYADQKRHAIPNNAHLTPRDGSGDVIRIPLKPISSAHARLRSGTAPENYLGEMTVGSGARATTFQTRFDLLSVQTLVQGPKCRRMQGCLGDKSYDERGTKANAALSTVLEGARPKTSIRGVVFEDDVQFDGISVQKPFYLASLAWARPFGGADYRLFDSNTQALMGLGDPRRTTEIKQLQSMVGPSGPLPYEFGFFFGSKTSNTQDFAELSLGGITSTLFTGPVSTMPIVDDTPPGVLQTWQVPLDAMIVNGKSYAYEGRPPNSVTAMFSTADNIITIPYDHLYKTKSSIPGSFFTRFSFSQANPIMPEYITLVVPCEAQFSLAFKFPGHAEFGLNIGDLILRDISGEWEDLSGFKNNRREAGSDDTKVCLTLLTSTAPTQEFGGGPPPDWSHPDDRAIKLGLPFLKSWYSIYTKSEEPGKATIGLASAIGKRPSFMDIVNRPVTGTVAVS